jgi:hypothetical protein
MNWLLFLRQYGPGSRTDNMYDETIQRSARNMKIKPIEFYHPAHDNVLTCFDKQTEEPISVILTGTAGDGKTHLCRQVWESLDGDPLSWASDDPYLSMTYAYPNREVTIHFIRDLSGWAPQQGLPWESHKEKLLQKFCDSLFDSKASDIFLIAANDGQLIESWRRLPDTQNVTRARRLIENLLVEDKQQEGDYRLRMFNLSRWNSVDLFDRAYAAFIEHPGWNTCYQSVLGENQAFSSKCPIRHNYELLKTPLVSSRLRKLIELCDYNGLHLPIRQILLLLSNAILGHPECSDQLMKPSDIPRLIHKGTVSKASIYNNIFGGNLPQDRRQGITVFEYLDRFQLGYETCNRIDNILIFGEGDPQLEKHFNALIRSDSFYGADEQYFAARDHYIESSEDKPDDAKDFLNLLIAQRRGLFFKIPEELAEELKLWELTVFRFAGEYLTDVIGTLCNGHNVKRLISSRLVKGLNRIFTGMLINNDRELFLASSGNSSQAKVSRILIDRISVEPRHGEKVVLNINQRKRLQLSVYLSETTCESLELNLVRYEFISRVATEGALPISFSKECYEDMLAFKSRLLVAYEQSRKAEGLDVEEKHLGLRILMVNEQGLPEDRFVEVNE